MGKWQVRPLAVTAAVAAVLTLSVSGCNRGIERIGQSGTETQKQEPDFKAGKIGDDYILPDAQTHVYAAAELSGLTPEELRIARNEIYARHGRMFGSDDLNRYFSGKNWYKGTVSPDSFDFGMLNQYEKGNLNVLQHLEEEKIVCTIPKIGVEEFPKIDGSTATLPLSQAIYRMSTGASVKEAEAAVVHSKTTDAWNSLIMDGKQKDGTGLVIAYEPGESVDAVLKDSGVRIIKKPIGRDALVFLENKSNPVKSLSQKQIVDIYTGKVKNWKELGGRNSKLEAFQRPEDSGSQNIMDKLVMKGQTMSDAPVDHVVGDMGGLLDKVSSYDNSGAALGYSVYYYAKNMHQNQDLAFMAVDGVKPSEKTIRDGSYPYVNNFYAGIREDTPKDSRAYQLFEWLTSEDGQSLINGLGYVGIKDSSKQLPKSLLEGNEETFTGKIPLPKGNVILASGDYLYGEAGTCVFDSGMHLLKFIKHVEVRDTAFGQFVECPEDEIVDAVNTKTGTERYFSIKDGRWVDKGKDGSRRPPDHHYDDSVYEEDDAEIAKLASDFASNHPDILKQYGAAPNQVEVWFFDGPDSILIIREGNMEHYYSDDGNHLLDYDTQGNQEEGLGRRYVDSVDAHTAYMSLNQFSADGHLMKTEYRIYRDGVLFTTISDNQDGTVMNISAHFYTRTRGNYLYFYNYQNEPCAKFLDGYYTED